MSPKLPHPRCLSGGSDSLQDLENFTSPLFSVFPNVTDPLGAEVICCCNIGCHNNDFSVKEISKSTRDIFKFEDDFFQV